MFALVMQRDRRLAVEAPGQRAGGSVSERGVTAPGAPPPVAAGTCPDENALALLGEAALDDAARAAIENPPRKRARAAPSSSPSSPGCPAAASSRRATAQCASSARGAMGIVWGSRGHPARPAGRGQADRAGARR